VGVRHFFNCIRNWLYYRALVHRNLVSREKFLEGESVVIECAHGDAVVYLLANVELEVQGVNVTVKRQKYQRHFCSQYC